LANDRDVDADQVSLTGIVTGPAHGTVLINPNGSVTYTPSPDHYGADSFNYVITGSNGGTATATASVTVNPVNDDPEARDDAFSLMQGESIAINVLANDRDVDADQVSLTGIVTGPAHGTAHINPNGTITYTPNDAFVGRDSFEYSIADGNGGVANATAVINVDGHSPSESFYATSGSNIIFEHTNSSKSFYHDDTWWAVLPDGSNWYVHQFDDVPGGEGAWTIASQPLLGSNLSADIAWDSTDEKLYVLQASATTYVYALQLEYSSDTKTWIDGAEVQLKGPNGLLSNGSWGDGDDLGIGLDQNGNPIVASISSQGLHVAYASGSDLSTWNQVTVDGGTTNAGGLNGDSKADIVTFSDDGLDYIGLVYSRDGNKDSWNFAWHSTETNPQDYGSDWTFETITSKVAIDDHISAVSDGTTIYATIKDDKDVIWLLKGSPGNWDDPIKVHDNGYGAASRPGIVLDESNNELYIFYQHGPAGDRDVFMKRADAANPEFNPSADGTLVIDGVSMRDPQGPAHPVGADTGGTFFVLAKEGDTVLYNDILLGSDELVA